MKKIDYRFTGLLIALTELRAKADYCDMPSEEVSLWMYREEFNHYELRLDKEEKRLWLFYNDYPKHEELLRLNTDKFSLELIAKILMRTIACHKETRD